MQDPDTSQERSESWDQEFLSSAPWIEINPLSSASSSTISPSNVDFLSSIDLTSPNAINTVLHQLFRPGSGFSAYTIEEALKGYVRASWIPVQQGPGGGAKNIGVNDPNARLRAALKKSYPTLRGRVGAIVGSRLGEFQPFSNIGLPNANSFGTSVIGEDGVGSVGIMKAQEEYFGALRRDWEGFLARCREIEKAGRWPVALGMVGLHTAQNSTGATDAGNVHCVVLERERIGMLVGEDEPLSIYRRVQAEMDEEREIDEMISEEDNNMSYQLIQLALSLKALFSPQSWAEVTNELYATIRGNISMTYEDILLDLARRVALEDLDDGTVAWVVERLEGVIEGEEQEKALNHALDGISALIRAAGNTRNNGGVKVEEDEEEVGAMLLNPVHSSSLPGLSTVIPDHHTPWTKSLTASYVSSTLEARHDIASAVIFLLMLLKFRGHPWMESVGAAVLDELFVGLRSTCILRGTAGKVMEGESPIPAPSQQWNGAQSRALVPRAENQVLSHRRAGTADSVAMRMAGLAVRQPSVAPILQGKEEGHVRFADAASSAPAMAILPPTVRGSGSVPLLQTILGPLKRAFSLPYASDSWLLENAIITVDSMLIASPDEVRFAEALRRKGEQVGKGMLIGSGLACFEAAAEVVDWLPKGPAACYVAGRLRVMKGDYDEAADLLERSGRSFGPLAFRNGNEAKALQAVLPELLEDLSSLSAYYEHIAQIFQDAGQQGFSVKFYKMAIEVLEEDHTTTGTTKRVDLWYSTFRVQLLAEEWEGAYMTIAQMPPSELRRGSVSELVVTMSERNKVELLMSFNFLGFSKDAEIALDFKARNADPMQRPCYSEILYAWYVKRGDYRRAATTMYHRARILGFDADNWESRFSLMSLQIRAYTNAIHALSLLDPRDAWIGIAAGTYAPDPAGLETSPPPASRPVAGLIGYGDDEYMQDGRFRDMDTSNDSEIVELEDIRRECELSRARIDLLLKIWLGRREKLEDADFMLSPLEVVHTYAAGGYYNEAFFSACIFQMDLRPVFDSMVDMCMRVAAGGDTNGEAWLRYEVLASWEGRSSAKAWRLLQTSLERHDSSSSGWQYRKACLERIMLTDQTSSPPTWLTAFFQEHEPEYLIRTYLRYHLILPAIDYTLSMIRKANQALEDGTVVGVTQTHLPYGLIDAVVAAAKFPEAKRRVELIKTEVAARVGKVGEWEGN